MKLFQGVPVSVFCAFYTKDMKIYELISSASFLLTFIFVSFSNVTFFFAYTSLNQFVLVPYFFFSVPSVSNPSKG